MLGRCRSKIKITKNTISRYELVQYKQDLRNPCPLRLPERRPLTSTATGFLIYLPEWAGLDRERRLRRSGQAASRSPTSANMQKIYHPSPQTNTLTSSTVPTAQQPNSQNALVRILYSVFCVLYPVSSILYSYITR